MEYHGKLYGKMGNKYFDTGSTSQDFDELQQKVDELAEQVLKLNLACVSQRSELLFCGVCEEENDHIEHADGSLECEGCGNIAKL